MKKIYKSWGDFMFLYIQFVSMCDPLTWQPILIQMISNFNSIFRNNSIFYV